MVRSARVQCRVQPAIVIRAQALRIYAETQSRDARYNKCRLSQLVALVNSSNPVLFQGWTRAIRL